MSTRLACVVQLMCCSFCFPSPSPFPVQLFPRSLLCSLVSLLFHIRVSSIVLFDVFFICLACMLCSFVLVYVQVCYVMLVSFVSVLCCCASFMLVCLVCCMCIYVSIFYLVVCCCFFVMLLCGALFM